MSGTYGWTGIIYLDVEVGDSVSRVVRATVIVSEAVNVVIARI